VQSGGDDDPNQPRHARRNGDHSGHPQFTPQDLHAQLEAMLRDEFHDIRRELIQEIRTRLYE
jgi:hypothetical protein